MNQIKRDLIRLTLEKQPKSAEPTYVTPTSDFECPTTQPQKSFKHRYKR